MKQIRVINSGSCSQLAGVDIQGVPADGIIDTAADITITTTVYIKMDVFDQLLLSEGVCRQLGLVTYHPSLVSRRVPKLKEEAALVPSIRVSLVQSVKLAPSQSVLVPVRLESSASGEDQTLLIEGEQLFAKTRMVMENATSRKMISLI